VEALKAIAGVALVHAHTATILTAVQDATLLCLKSFKGGWQLWEMKVQEKEAEACAQTPVSPALQPSPFSMKG
jgi:hypothetical protein